MPTQSTHAVIATEQRHTQLAAPPVHKRGPLVRLEHGDVAPQRDHHGEGHVQHQVARHMQRVELPAFLHKVRDPAGRQPPPRVDRHLHHQAQEHHDVEEEGGHEDARRGHPVVRGLVLVEKAAAVGEAPPPLLPKDPADGDEADERGRRHRAHGHESCKEGIFLLHVGKCARWRLASCVHPT